jgi:hypothetical protein
MLLEVSLADGLDRLTILEIKQMKIRSPEKLVEIQKEIDALHEFAPFKQTYAFHYGLLLYTNLQVWDSMDKVNATDPTARNTVDFADLAAKVYEYNDQRFRIKRLLNTMSCSALKEQKSYGAKHVTLSVRDVYACIPVINYLSVQYDTVSFQSEHTDVLKRIFTTPNFVYEDIPSDKIDADTVHLPDRSAYEFPPITYLASGLLGDFIHQLSVVNENYRACGRKGIVYMTDSIEPFRWGVVRTHEDISPFLKKQSYIQDVRIHDGSMCDVNLSTWRSGFDYHTDSWHTIFNRHYGVSWSETPWFKTDEPSDYANTVFISTSPNRWWTEPFDHEKLINTLGPDVRFLASDRSNYDHFVATTGLHLPLVLTPSFTDLVNAIQGCALFVSTLSAPLSIADALHKKRIALQLEDYDGYIAAKTNPSFITYRTNLDTLQR